MSKRSCMFEDTRLDVGMAYLHVSTMKVTRLHARVVWIFEHDYPPYFCTKRKPHIDPCLHLNGNQIKVVQRVKFFKALYLMYRILLTY